MNDFEEMTKEELIDLLDHSEEIECGGEPWETDDGQDYIAEQIKDILINKFGMIRKDL